MLRCWVEVGKLHASAHAPLEPSGIIPTTAPDQHQKRKLSQVESCIRICVVIHVVARIDSNLAQSRFINYYPSLFTTSPLQGYLRGASKVLRRGVIGGEPPPFVVKTGPTDDLNWSEGRRCAGVDDDKLFATKSIFNSIKQQHRGTSCAAVAQKKPFHGLGPDITIRSCAEQRPNLQFEQFLKSAGPFVWNWIALSDYPINESGAAAVTICGSRSIAVAFVQS